MLVSLVPSSCTNHVLDRISLLVFGQALPRRSFLHDPLGSAPNSHVVTGVCGLANALNQGAVSLLYVWLIQQAYYIASRKGLSLLVRIKLVLDIHGISSAGQYVSRLA